MILLEKLDGKSISLIVILWGLFSMVLYHSLKINFHLFFVMYFFCFFLKIFFMKTSPIKFMMKNTSGSSPPYANCFCLLICFIVVWLRFQTLKWWTELLPKPISCRCFHTQCQSINPPTEQLID